MKNSFILSIVLLLFLQAVSPAGSLEAQDQEEKDLDKIRSESGVDPTRVMSRAGYTLMIIDKSSYPGQLTNRLALNLGVNRWSFSAKYDLVMKLPSSEGSGFNQGFGDMKFSLLNAFFVRGKSALAGAVEFSLPTGKAGIGSQYFTATPSLTFSYTLNPTLFLALQPQYTFDLMKDPLYPHIDVITIRAFLAKFTRQGYFFVIEPRPVIDLGNENFDLIISPIVGKALGGGFNLIALMEIPTKKETYSTTGALYQFGFNKSF